MILNRCRYAFVFPCPVTIAVKFCVRFIFIFRLFPTFGKYSFVVLPLVVCVQFLCYFFALSCSNSLVTTLFGILLYSTVNDSFFAAFFASVSAKSFPINPACALTQQRYTSQFALLISMIFLLVSSIKYVCIFVFRSLSNVILLSVYIVIFLSVLCVVSMYCSAVSIANFLLGYLCIFYLIDAVCF